MDDNVFFDADNNVTDHFKEQLSTLVGDSFKNEAGEDTKVFENLDTLPAILQDHVRIHRAYGKKQENVIQKVGADASDVDKAGYIKLLAGEMGLSKSVEDLKFEHGDIPDGMKIKKKMEAGFKELVVKEEIPTRYANMIMKWFNGVQAADFTADKETKAKAFTEAADKFEADFPGDNGIEHNRVAFNAIRKFNADNPDMIKTMDGSGVYADPLNLVLWKSIGIMPSDLRTWGMMGSEMGVSSSPSGDVHKPGDGGSMQDAVDAMFPNTPKEYNKVG